MKQRSSPKHGLLSSSVLAAAARSGYSLTSYPADSPATRLGKRDAEGTLRKPTSNNRAASRFRGVTHHCRTNRYESHIWENGKQVYLGGYYTEAQAALAYDLAAVKFRGEEAISNFDLSLYKAELVAAEQVTREEVVQSLRSQSKAMNSVDLGVSEGSAALRLDDWELLLSSLVHAEKEHLGVYGTEAEAARAADRRLVARKGVDAFAACNFALVDYMDLLTPEQVAEGVEKGVLPAELPADYSPVAAPRPILLVHAAVPPVRMGSAGAAAASCGRMAAACGSPAATEAGSAGGGGGAVPTPQQPVPRRKSATPRSALDFPANDAEPFGGGGGGAELGHGAFLLDLTVLAGHSALALDVGSAGDETAASSPAKRAKLLGGGDACGADDSWLLLGAD